MRLISCGAFLLSLISYGAQAQPGGLEKRWIERPWEYRYLLYVDDIGSWSFDRKSHATELATRPKTAFNYAIPLPVYFDAQWVLNPRIPEDSSPSLWPSLNIVRLDVSRDRTVKQRPLGGDQLWGRLNSHEDVVLAPSDTNPAYVVAFGEFFMGSSEASDPRYSPAICSTIHGDTVPPDQGGRYGLPSKMETSSAAGFFGCREWAAQLYDVNRPYIDVTSYEMEQDYDRKPDKRGKHPLKPTTYIKPFIGFARFSDPVKPVIGKYGEQWYCITDCPVGDAPGEIADIKAWAARSGWPVPQRPKNPRAFMNKPLKPGSFVD